MKTDFGLIQKNCRKFPNFADYFLKSLDNLNGWGYIISCYFVSAVDTCSLCGAVRKPFAGGVRQESVGTDVLTANPQRGMQIWNMLPLN